MDLTGFFSLNCNDLGMNITFMFIFKHYHLNIY